VALQGRLPTPQTLTDSGTLLTLLALLVNQGAWAVGIHGGKIVHAWLPGIFAPAGAPFDPALAWRPLVDNFVHLGGSGATLGLAIALLVAVRSGPQRRLAKASLLPSVFNVNELLVFGLPVVLHPRYLLPFIGVPMLLALASLAAIHAGWLPVQPRSIHWTTPVLLSGWQLTGSWVGAAWQALGVALSIACYLPVVRRVEKLRLQAERQAVGEACLGILAARGQHRQALRQADQTGEIARVLLADLRHDLHTPALHLAYQPKHHADGRVSGVEALLRWSHSRFGPVRADAAITLAEDGRLVQALGLQVLEQACACKARWNGQGLAGLTMAVNVSPMQLDDPGFADAVADALRRHGLSPGELELEITESQAIPRDRALDHNMARLHQLGVRVAIDDFGMGHSSLVHLRRFQIHAIKIDGSLTRDVLTQPTCADIVRSIAGLAQARGLDVVAEFVETAAQRDTLAMLGCTHFQGYLHAAPLPEALCLAHLIEHGARGTLAAAAAPALPSQPAATVAACT
jgi:EAL domain-containing protein (putative c-di-GMP-specific phosphodiesterase class I)